MPTKEKITKTVQRKEPFLNELQAVGEKLMKHLKAAKKKFDQLDSETKKKVIARVAGAVALLAGIYKTKKAIKKMKKKREQK